MKTKSIARFSLLCTMALVLGYFERFIPVAPGIPGVKLGLTAQSSNAPPIISMSFLPVSFIKEHPYALEICLYVFRNVLEVCTVGGLYQHRVPVPQAIIQGAHYILAGIEVHGLDARALRLFAGVLH